MLLLVGSGRSESWGILAELTLVVDGGPMSVSEMLGTVASEVIASSGRLDSEGAGVGKQRARQDPDRRAIQVSRSVRLHIDSRGEDRREVREDGERLDSVLKEFIEMPISLVEGCDLEDGLGALAPDIEFCPEGPVGEVIPCLLPSKVHHGDESSPIADLHSERVHGVKLGLVVQVSLHLLPEISSEARVTAGRAPRSELVLQRCPVQGQHSVLLCLVLHPFFL